MIKTYTDIQTEIMLKELKGELPCFDCEEDHEPCIECMYLDFCELGD